jgi:Asp-tRNA(Asn)/Glu-tRNA(Gln) amidotransferase A subunit family amidase
MSAPTAPASALDLARSVGAGDRSAESVAAECADALAAREPQLRAFAAFDRATLIESAQALDRDAALRAAPLAGVPVAVKDVIDTAQYPTAYGSPIYAGHRPALDAACVALLRQAGAPVLGKTVTAELAFLHPGPTRNPHAPDHTPGGSSSGSAAAVAAGLAPLALGTQTAGSVIRPASFCGVVGYKPSPRLIPRSGVKVVSDTLDEVGLFARSVDDAALLASVLAQQPGWAGQPAAGRGGPPPRVGWQLSSQHERAEPAMRRAVEQAAQRAWRGGAAQAQAQWPELFEALFDAQRTIQWAEMARALGPEYAYRRDQLAAPTAQAIAEALAFAPQRYPQALQLAKDCRRRLDEAFNGADLIIAPSAPGEAPRGLNTTGDPLFNRPWQLLGCPMINLPFGRGPQGLPLGVCAIARPGDDGRLFAWAAWLEASWLLR